MDIYASEEEQVKAIKKWFKENTVSLIVGIGIGLVLVFGWREWLKYEYRQSAEAANDYAKIINALGKNQTEEALRVGDVIVEKYHRTAYAELAALAMAKADVENNDIASAKNHLIWAAQNAKLAPIGHVARQRLIRILLAENSLNEAEQRLNEVAADNAAPAEFLAGYEELWGDLALAQGNPEQAAQRYQKAMAALPADSPYRGLLELKMGGSGHSGALGQP